MSASENDNKFRKDIENESTVSSIEFYYDGLTGNPKFRIKQSPSTDVDPLSLYAMACTTVFSKYEEEVVELMHEYMIESPISTKLH